MSDPGGANQKVTSLSVAGWGDGKRFTVHTLGGTSQKAIRNADNSVAKDLGSDAVIKGYDVAAFSDGRTLLAWDDGADIWAQVYASAGDKEGVPFQVNAQATGKQTRPRVATLPNGRYVIAWNTDQGGGDVAAQVFKQEPGAPLGSEIAVNATTSGVQQHPQIGVYADGSFVIAFEDGSGKDGSGRGVLGQWYTSTSGKVGGEKVVDATTSGDQRAPMALGLVSDEVVIAWTGPDGHVYVRRFDKQGNNLAGSKEFLVPTQKAGEQADPAIASGGDGSFVVAWDSDGVAGDGGGIALQRYGSKGEVQGSEVIVNTFKPGQQRRPAIGAAKTGFAVAWESFDQSGDELEGIRAQRFKPDGSKVGAELAVNQTLANEQQRPTLAMQPSGKFAIAWESFAQPKGLGYDIVARCFDDLGMPLKGEAIVNTTVADKQLGPALAAFPDDSGKYVLVWQSLGEDGSEYGIFGQLLFQDCTPIGPPFAINTFTQGEQSQPRVAVDGIGQMTVVWRSAGQDGSSFGIFGQTLDKNGQKLGSEWKTHAITDNEQSRPAVAYLPDGRLVVLWQTVGEDEAGFAIQAAIRDAKGQQGLDWLVHTTFAGNQMQPAVLARVDGSFAAVWTSVGQDGDKGGVVGRVLK